MPRDSIAIELADLRHAAGHACRLMKVLSNPDRLLLLCQLVQGEQRVGELAARVGLPQPTLPQQLGVLRDEGLVSTRRDGKAIYCRIDSAQAHALMLTLHEQFCQPATKMPA